MKRNKLKKGENPLHLFYEYRPSRYEANSPLGVRFQADTMGHQPPLVKKNGASYYQPIVATDYKFFGELDSLARCKYQQGKFNSALALGLCMAIDNAQNTLYYTTGTNPHIQICDANLCKTGRILKIGYDPQKLDWFTLQDVQALRRAGISGDDIVWKLDVAVYGMSVTESQLEVNHYACQLYRLYSKPLEGQNRQFWYDAFDQGIRTYIAADSLRARTLQIYDLAAGGRFDGEIEVPPLFRILGIDPQGNLWAVTAVDETSVTVGRFRLLREGD